MKRSFYEMLDVPRKATQEQIDTAFAQLTRKLDATTSVRGTAEAMNELNTLRDGYNILSNPEKRAVYDAKLYATEAGIQLIFFPKDTKAVRKLGINTVIFASLACVFTFMIYQRLTRDTNAVRLDAVTTASSTAAQTQTANIEPPTAAPSSAIQPAANSVDAKAGARSVEK